MGEFDFGGFGVGDMGAIGGGFGPMAGLAGGLMAGGYAGAGFLGGLQGPPQAGAGWLDAMNPGGGIAAPAVGGWQFPAFAGAGPGDNPGMADDAARARALARAGNLSGGNGFGGGYGDNGAMNFGGAPRGGGYGGGGGGPRYGAPGGSNWEGPTINHGIWGGSSSPYYQALRAQQGQQQQMAGQTSAWEQAYAQARQANEQRYKDVLGIYDQRIGNLDTMSNQGKTDIQNQGTQQNAAMQQGAVSRGLGNTTITDSLARGINTDTQSNLNRFNDMVLGNRNQLLQDKAGFMERRNDVYPDMGLMASLQQGVGAAGGGGYGGLPAGGGQDAGFNYYASMGFKQFVPGTNIPLK